MDLASCDIGLRRQVRTRPTSRAKCHSSPTVQLQFSIAYSRRFLMSAITRHSSRGDLALCADTAEAVTIVFGPVIHLNGSWRYYSFAVCENFTSSKVGNLA
jgi:hypothetical protein